MITINMYDYPNFTRPLEHNNGLTWEEEFWVVGLKSVKEVYGGYAMSEEDYTMFILRFG